MLELIYDFMKYFVKFLDTKIYLYLLIFLFAIHLSVLFEILIYLKVFFHPVLAGMLFFSHHVKNKVKNLNISKFLKCKFVCVLEF